MIIKSKRFLRNVFISALTILLCLTCFVSLKTLREVKAAAAAPQNLKVDTLGFLRWDEVDGATGYEWSYSTDGGTNYSTPATSAGTEADISMAISKAVGVAQGNSAANASLKLKVKSLPDGGETVVDYNPTTYINFGYSKHDISQVYAPTAAEGGKAGSAAFIAHSVLYTNELMSFGLSFSTTESKYYIIGFLNQGNASPWTDYFYDLTIYNSGAVTSCRQRSYSATHTFNKAMTAGEASYFALGVFDTYSVSSGEWIGETVYMSRTDVVNGKPVVVGTIERLFDATIASTERNYLPSDRPEHLPEAKNHTAVNNTTDDGTNGKTGTVPKDSFGLLSSSDTGAVLKSGLIPASSTTASAPSIVYYDNVTGQVRWNRAENATGYEWSYAGKTNWETTAKEYIPAEQVAAAIQSAKTNGQESVRFAVRAVGANGKSTTEYCALDLNAFYTSDVRSTLKDISAFVPALKDPSATLTNKYSYNNTGFGKNTFVENAFVFTDVRADYRLLIGLHASKWMDMNGYVVSIYVNGNITIGRNSSQGTGNNAYWQRANAVAFELNKKYVATYGVEELFDLSGNKVADRITVKISEIEADGYRKLLTIISFDNYEYDWTGTTVLTYPNYSTCMNLLCAPAASTFCDVSCVTSDYAYQVTPVINGKAITDETQTVAYGQEYDFTSVLETQGYELDNAQWKYKLTPSGEEKTFYLKGYWNIHFNYEGQNAGGFYTEVDYTEYTIDYDISAVAGVTNTENPTTYTLEDEITLKAPQVPNGYVFKGWYKNFQAGEYSDQVEKLEQDVGDLTLYARIVRGYDICITFDNQAPVHMPFDEDSVVFTLPNTVKVYAKEFAGWYVKNGNAFEAYTGELTFTPTSNMEFWAKYNYKNYTVTYNVDGGSHTNPATYTAENVLTFAPAEKEGYFFDGWYDNEEFLGARVADTDGLTQDMTLYAKYIVDEESRTVKYSLSEKIQKLPILELPVGSTYTMKLYEEGKSEELDIIENVAYVFDKECKYTLKYFITLPSGEEIEREIIISVETAKIAIDGTYQEKYVVGDELTIFDGILPDGTKAAVEVKKDGEVIELNGNTIVLEEGKYEIIYKDEAGIVQSIMVSFEVRKSYLWPIVGISAGVVVLIGAGVAITIAVKKRKNDEE